MPENNVDLSFNPRDLNGNAEQLVKFFRYKSEADVQVAKFTIETSDEKIEEVVRVGKYKSALFLLYLSILIMAEHSKFTMNARLRDFAKNYFGEEICRDAIVNPNTKHTTVRALFKDGAVVSLSFEPQH